MQPDEQAALQRQPAKNDEAEQAVLAWLLWHPHQADQLRDHLDETDFYRPAHGLIWQAIWRCVDSGLPPDHIAVADDLGRHRDIARVGGPVYLFDLRDNHATPDQAAYYAKLVRDAARIRRVQDAAIRLGQVAGEAAANPELVETALERAIDTLDTVAARFGPHTTAATPTGMHDLSFLLDPTAPIPEPQPPAWMRRDDGNALFYAGRVNGLFGDPETGKTWLAKAAGVEAMAVGRQFAYIDVDHNGLELTVAHLVLLGAKREWLGRADLFRYYEPDDAAELTAAVRDIAAHKPAVAVLDSVGEIFPMLGVKTNDGDEMTLAMRHILNPIADAGTCVITIDHLPKSKEAREAGFAIGAAAKKRAIDGAYLLAEVVVVPAPGQVGRVTLRVSKDRPGGLRKHCAGGKYAGQFRLDSRDEHQAVATVVANTGAVDERGRFRPTGLMEAVSISVEHNPHITATQLEKAVRGKREHIRAAIAVLIEDGYMATSPGPRNSTEHRMLKPYREADDNPEMQVQDDLW